MKVTNEKTENRQAFLTIEVGSAEVEQSLEKAYHRLVKKVNVPGFRKGKATRAVLESYIGRDGLLEEAINKLLPEVYQQAIDEQGIEAIAQPQIEITQNDPLVFKAVVPLKPSVELGDYRSIRLGAESVQVGEEEIDSMVDHLRRRYAVWEPVERAVDFGDTVILDVESSVEDKPFINKKQGSYQVIRDLPFPAPGFSQQLVGMVKDEEKEFKLEFPLDYPSPELIGKEASFKVSITEIKQERLPEVDDEFARQVNPECEGIESLREQIARDLLIRVQDRARRDFEERVVEAVVDQAEVEFPPVLVEDGIDRLIEEQVREWSGGSSQGIEEYLTSLNKTEEELREELYPLAVKRVTSSLVVGKVAEEEKIEVDDAEIDTEIENLTSSAGERKDEIKKLFNTAESRQSIGRMLIGRKTIQRLAEIAESKATDAASGAEAEAPG